MMDTSSQETTDSESKPMDAEEQRKEEEREDVNGTEREREAVDGKIENLIPSDNALTTSA